MHFGTNPGHSKMTRSICAMISHKDPIRNISPENITWDLASPGKYRQSRVKLKETTFRDRRYAGLTRSSIRHFLLSRVSQSYKTLRTRQFSFPSSWNQGGGTHISPPIRTPLQPIHQPVRVDEVLVLNYLFQWPCCGHSHIHRECWTWSLIGIRDLTTGWAVDWLLPFGGTVPW